MDVNNNLVDSYVYDPYGVTEHQTGSQYNPYQFAGGYFDSYTLYYKYGTRYYDRFGRWTQKDSQPSANPYVYANDDPVNVVDPSGAAVTPGCIVGVIAGVANAILTSYLVIAPQLTLLLGATTITAGVVAGALILVGLAYAIAVLVGAFLYCAMVP